MNSSLSTDTHPFRHTVLQAATAKYKSARLSIIGKLLLSLYYNGAEYGESARDMSKLSPSLSLSYKVFKNNDFYIRASYKIYSGHQHSMSHISIITAAQTCFQKALINII